MDVSFSFDLPPVPECFSKLLVDDGDETSALPNQPWREAERLRELKEIMLKSLAQETVPETPLVVNGGTEMSETPLDTEVQGDSIKENCDGNGHGETESKVDPEMTQVFVKVSPVGAGSASPFCRLNTALGRLKREMVDLRHMDMSLFCQLLSLNEAIQDFKMSVNDRYSEYTGSEYTGSEYSFGGMGSRTGSFTSLNDENDWGGDDPSSPLSTGEANEESIADGLASSTSSLLQQIKALTQRAEADF